MPYFLHIKNEAPESGQAFYLGSHALSACDHATHKVTFVPDDSEKRSWRERETARFDDAEYIRVPWQHIDKYPDHYVHISTKTPGLVAYTKDERSGYEDKQTAVRAGRYLTQFYADVLSAEEITRYANLVTAESSAPFKIARTADDIQAVYENGPRSCMAHTYGSAPRNCKVCMRDSDATHYTYTQAGMHPVRVYGDSDLAVAYIGNANERVTARAVVWPDQKVFSTVYGSVDTLTRMLQNAGYADGSLRGAHVQAIDADAGGYVLPYIDGISYAEVVRHGGRSMIRLGSGNLDCSNTTGLSGDPDEESDDFHCDNCNDYYSDQHYGGTNPRGTRTYCSDCYSEMYSTCDSCHSTVDSEDTHDTSDGRLCDDCYSNNSTDCAVCEDSFNSYDWTRSERSTRERNDTESLCDDCADTHAHCSQCDTYYPTNVDVASAPDDLHPVLFAGADTVTSGIRSYAVAVDSANPYACVCDECNRTIRPDDVPDLFCGGAYIDSAIPETFCGEVNRHADIRPIIDCIDAPATVQSFEYRPIANVYRKTRHLQGTYYRLLYNPKYSASYRWPYVEHSVYLLNGAHTLDAACMRMTECRNDDRAAVQAWYESTPEYTAALAIGAANLALAADIRRAEIVAELSTIADVILTMEPEPESILPARLD